MPSKNKYRHLFFDLDNTLFDFDASADLALDDMFNHFKLKTWFSSEADFKSIFEVHNTRLWNAYRLNQVNKKEVKFGRFLDTLRHRTTDADHLVEEMADFFLMATTNKNKLVEGTIETLDYLKPRYAMHIISNGFKEVQMTKINQCGLTPYFNSVLLSEQAKAQKPSPEFFHMALSRVNARKRESLVIGDLPETDIEGGRNYGIDTVYFNYDKRIEEVDSTYRIDRLIELKNLL